MNKPQAVILHGYAGVGKDTVASYLAEDFGYETVRFADPIKRILEEMNPYLDPWGTRLEARLTTSGWDEAKRTHKEIRTLMQKLGQSMRDHTYAEIWADTAVIKPKDQTTFHCYADARYMNEIDAVLTWYGRDETFLVRIQRPGFEPVNGHISDAGLDPELFDHTLVNDGTLTELEAEIDDMLSYVWPRLYGVHA